jgi:O-methyltransferase
MSAGDKLGTANENTESLPLPKLPIGPTAAPLDSAAAERYRTALAGESRMAAFVDFVIAGLLTRDHRDVFWGDRMLTLDKSAGFLKEPAFAAALQAIEGSHQYDQYRSAHGIAWRLHTLVWAAKSALALPHGDFVECGVFKGDMAWTIAQVTGFFGTGRVFHLYDSFAGFDPGQSTPADFPDGSGFFKFAQAIYSQPGLYEGVVARFESAPWFRVHRGFLPGSLDHADAPDRIAFLHLDLNSPTAEIGCLERLFDRVVSGGTIVLDDYGWSLCRAQKEAEDRFFAGRGYAVLELPTGQGLVVKR